MKLLVGVPDVGTCFPSAPLMPPPHRGALPGRAKQLAAIIARVSRDYQSYGPGDSAHSLHPALPAVQFSAHAITQQAVALQLVLQRAPADAEQPRGRGAVRSRVCDRLRDEQLLRLLDRHAGVN